LRQNTFVLQAILTQQISIPHLNISLFIRREDLLHPYISGNKLRKLKYNLAQAKVENQNAILTFGGAFSNHIAATAYAGKEYGFKTIGIIRGEELQNKIDENPTLKFAQQCGMQFKFVTRDNYRCKSNIEYIDNLKEEFGNFYLVPEGGTNELAIQGCGEILSSDDHCYDYVCVSVGTGGTISGLINSSFPHQKILGFPALKGDFLNDEIRKFVKNDSWELITDYHFGGYGKVDDQLISFINQFYINNKVPLDPIYTGKMVFGVLDLIKSNYFPSNAKILLIHTGGLQGVAGINNKLENKKLQIINFDV
jgi:1-aminocyclopropane-1-carboxylate deaminase